LIVGGGQPKVHPSERRHKMIAISWQAIYIIYHTVTHPQDMPVQRGFVAFLDVLGYGSLIAHPSINETVREVVNTVSQCRINTEEAIRARFKGDLSMDNEQILESVLARIKWLIFSDTIVITFDTLSGFPDDHPYWHTYWRMFLTQISQLYCDLFSVGLPLRGAITYGEYVSRDYCFGGKPIVDAHLLCEALDFSGIAVDRSAMDALSQRLPSIQNTSDWPISINEKDKRAEMKQYFVVNVLRGITKATTETFLPPTKLKIEKAFSSHGKNLALAGEKVDKTTRLIKELVREYFVSAILKTGPWRIV
jgi:hypothetical protein